MKKFILIIVAALLLCLNSGIVYDASSEEGSTEDQIVYKTPGIHKLTPKEKKAIKKSLEFLASVYEEEEVEAKG